MQLKLKLIRKGETNNNRAYSTTRVNLMRWTEYYVQGRLTTLLNGFVRIVIQLSLCILTY